MVPPLPLLKAVGGRRGVLSHSALLFSSGLHLGRQDPSRQGGPSALLSLPVPMLISSRNTFTDTSKIMFEQICRHLVAHSSCHIKLISILSNLAVECWAHSSALSESVGCAPSIVFELINNSINYTNIIVIPVIFFRRDDSKEFCPGAHTIEFPPQEETNFASTSRFISAFLIVCVRSSDSLWKPSFLKNILVISSLITEIKPWACVHKIF